MTRTSDPGDPNDPKGLIREAFRIEGITGAECRSIFVDWALSLAGDDHRLAIEALLAQHGAGAEDHPMTQVLREGLTETPKVRRRGGRAARLGEG